MPRNTRCCQKAHDFILSALAGVPNYFRWTEPEIRSRDVFPPESWWRIAWPACSEHVQKRWQAHLRLSPAASSPLATMSVVSAGWQGAHAASSFLPPSDVRSCLLLAHLQLRSPLTACCSCKFSPLSLCNLLFLFEGPLVNIHFAITATTTMISCFLGCLACLSFNQPLHISCWPNFIDRKTDTQWLGFYKGPLANKWQDQNLNPGSLVPVCAFLPLLYSLWFCFLFCFISVCINLILHCVVFEGSPYL